MLACRAEAPYAEPDTALRAAASYIIGAPAPAAPLNNMLQRYWAPRAGAPQCTMVNTSQLCRLASALPLQGWCQLQKV